MKQYSHNCGSTLHTFGYIMDVNLIEVINRCYECGTLNLIIGTQVIEKPTTA